MCQPLYLLVVLLIALHPHVSSAQSSSLPGVRILTAEELRQAGVARPADLFALLDDWEAVSTEGYHWDVASGGLAPLQASAWVLLVDGQPVDLGLLDAPSLNALPLLLEEIDYVEAISRPVLVGGVLAPSGTLHVHTRRPEGGISVRGTASAGNETGDPGPYRYTALASPNIDRIGPTLGTSASAGGAHGHLRLTFRSDEHHATDEQIARRVRHLYLGDKSPRLLLTTTGLDAALYRAGEHRLQAGFFRLQDLRFAEPLGLETPTDHRFYHAGVSGDFRPSRPTGMRYRLSYAVSDLPPRVNRGGLDFDFRQDRARGNLEARIGTPGTQGTLGLSVDHLRSTSSYVLTTDALLIPQGYARFDARSVPFEGSLTLQALVADGEVGYGALATLLLRPTETHTLALHAAAIRQPYVLQNTLWYWATQGYDFLATHHAAFTLPAAFSSPTSYVADLSWTVRPDARVEVSVSGAYRRFLGQTVAVHRFAFDPETEGFAAETTVRPDVAGQVVQIAAEMRLRLMPGLTQRFYYHYRRYPDVSELFFLTWRNQPWHRFSYTARYAPIDRLSLYARLAYHSDALWPAYHRASDQTQGRYPSRLPDTWRLDLSVQKRFWHDHLQAGLSLRNALNVYERMHPAGAVSRMTLYVRLEAYFNAGSDRG